MENIGSSENVEIIEEQYVLDKIESTELIRFEFNMIEFPLFTKSRKLKKGMGKRYVFNKEGNKYLEVVPTIDYKIPGEFEEEIFLGLMVLLRQSKYKSIVYTNFYDLMITAGIPYSGVYLKKTKEALDRCANTTYRFNDIFYISPNKKGEKGKVASRKIVTKMFDYEVVTLHQAEEGEKQYFKNKRMKEIIKIDFSSFFYDNIIRRGYLYFDSNVLRSFEHKISRNLFIMITKWRNKKLYLKRYSKFIAGRLPLSWENKNRSQTIKTITKGFEEIKAKGHIKDYNFEKNKKLDESYFEVFFLKKHNKNLFESNTGQEVLDLVTEKALVDMNEEKEQLILNFKNNQKEITAKKFQEELEEYAESLGYSVSTITLNSLRVPFKMKNNYKIIEEE